MSKRVFRIATVLGARPQFVKAAGVSRLLRKRATEILIHTGQHYDWGMSGRFFSELGIPAPAYNLGIGSGTHGKQTGAMMIALEPVLMREKPDLVLVYGDTNSTAAAALVAAKLHIPVAHVEAGMRSFDRSMPEELNRVVTDHLATLLFCPSDVSVHHLVREGLTRGVINVGDNMLDVLFQQLPRAKKSMIIKRLHLQPGGYHLATLHRPANTDTRSALLSVLNSFKAIAEPIVFPVHPRTSAALQRFGLQQKVKAISSLTILQPLGFTDMLALMLHAKTILTDSGGIQKEAFSIKVPCITMRENTEWTETVTLGWNVLVGNDPKKIVRAVHRARRPRRHEFVYGHGHASKKIVAHLLRFLRSTH